MIRPAVCTEWIRATEVGQLLTVVVFGASIGIAFVSPLVAELTWIVMIFGFRSRLLRRGRSPP